MELIKNKSKDTFIINDKKFSYPKDFEMHLLQTYLANKPSMELQYYSVVMKLQEMLEENDIEYYLKFYVTADGSEHKFNFDPNKLNNVLDFLVYSPHEGYF